MDNTKNLENALSQLWEREKDFGSSLDDAAEKEHKYKMKFARSILTADGKNAETREAQALIECEEEYEAHLKAKAVATFTKEKLKDCQDALSARQTLLSYEVKTNFGQMQGGR